MKIGVVVPLAATPETGHSVRYAETRAFAQQAAATGFDSLWLYDHLLYRAPNQPTHGIWEAWTVLSALAEATTQVELGTLVLCAPFRTPAVLAKMAVTLDEVSGGRVILGLGAGWHQPEFEAFGIPFDRTGLISDLCSGQLAWRKRAVRADRTGRHPAIQDAPEAIVCSRSRCVGGKRR